MELGPPPGSITNNQFCAYEKERNVVTIAYARVYIVPLQDHKCICCCHLFMSVNIVNIRRKKAHLFSGIIFIFFSFIIPPHFLMFVDILIMLIHFKHLMQQSRQGERYFRESGRHPIGSFVAPPSVRIFGILTLRNKIYKNFCSHKSNATEVD